MKAAKLDTIIGARTATGLVRNVKASELVTLTETDRVTAALGEITDAAIPPWQCSGAIPVAPARGPVERFTPFELVLDGKGGLKSELMGYRGRDGARVRDVFDEMVDQARRAHARKGKTADPSEPPFTYGQVQAGGDYAALTERCNASGVKCSSLESLHHSGSGGSGREEAMFADFARLRALHRRIGNGLAKQLRRYRPSTTSTGPDPRKSITARRLVDQICLSERTLKEILKAEGWTVNAKIIRDLRTELCAALDRMQGYQPNEPQNMG